MVHESTWVGLPKLSKWLMFSISDGRREGAGALPNGTFGVAHGVLPGARAGVGLRPPQAHRAAAGVNTKYSKADLMDVFHKMKDEVREAQTSWPLLPGVPLQACLGSSHVCI